MRILVPYVTMVGIWTHLSLRISPTARLNIRNFASISVSPASSHLTIQTTGSAYPASIIVSDATIPLTVRNALRVMCSISILPRIPPLTLAKITALTVFTLMLRTCADDASLIAKLATIIIPAKFAIQVHTKSLILRYVMWEVVPLAIISRHQIALVVNKNALRAVQVLIATPA